MAYFNELDKIINNVVAEKILRNQNICKLLYYYPTEKIYNYNPFSQPDIVNTSILLMEKVFPLPKMPDSNTDKSGYMTVTLTGGESSNDNQGFENVDLVFDLIFHLDTWFIKNGSRPYRIAEEIDRMFNNQQTDLPVNNRPIRVGFKQRDYSDYFYGLQIVYQLSVDSNIGCGINPTTSNTSLNLDLTPSFLPKNIGLR